MSTDPVLNSLLQLVVLKLKGDRAFVSLIDDQFQFIVAEATKSISLVDGLCHDEGDGLCIGTRPLALDAGICAATMPAFITEPPTEGPSIHTSNIYADTTRYVINDLTIEDLYKFRPYVIGHPHMRWYAEVPLRTAAGHAIGSLAVVDSKSRTGLQEDEFRIISEVASAIMRHLELLRIDSEHSRAANLLMGLDKFMHQRPSVPVVRRHSSKLLMDSKTVNVSAADQPESFATTSEFPRSYEPRTDQSSRSNSGVGISERTATPILSDAEPVRKARSIKEFQSGRSRLPYEASMSDMQRNGEEVVDTHQEPRSETFQSASSFLRDATDLDGVVFVDTIQTVGSRYEASPTQGSPISAESKLLNLDAAMSSIKSRSPTTNRHIHQSFEEHCERLGSAFSGNTKIHAVDSSTDDFVLPIEVMQSLLYHFPQGAIFKLDKISNTAPLTYESTQTSDRLYPTHKLNDHENTTEGMLDKSSVERKLRSCLPSSRSIIFHPLWNSRTESWYAACIAWSNDSRRLLQSSDLSYITAFSNSITAEIVNLELLAIDNAKSDFISSISHEIRSPLHGILGSAEVLLETPVSKEQQQLLQVVENCGRNLLDTMDNM